MLNWVDAENIFRPVQSLRIATYGMWTNLLETHDSFYKGKKWTENGPKVSYSREAWDRTWTWCSAYLYSDRKTWFCDHTIVRYHCSLFHHYHLHNLFPHHSATDQECNFHQGDTEIHAHYNQQENESLKLKWRREAEGGKTRETLWFCFIILPSIFSFFRHCDTRQAMRLLGLFKSCNTLEHIHIHFRSVNN